MADSTLEHAFFYNSNDGDRVYDASSFEYWLKKFFTSGVFADECQVTADGTGMTCSMAEGYANVDGKVKFWDEAQDLALENASSSYDRIDAVVIERNDTDRDITVKIVQGTYAASPTAPDVERDDGVYQLVIAQIYVAAGATAITQADITDTRTDTDLCGYVAATVENVDFSQFTAQYESFIANYSEKVATDYETYKDLISGDYDSFYSSLVAALAEYKEEFESWYDGIKGILGEDEAGALQLEIEELTDRFESSVYVDGTTQYVVTAETTEESDTDSGETEESDAQDNNPVIETIDINGTAYDIMSNVIMEMLLAGVITAILEDSDGEPLTDSDGNTLIGDFHISFK